MKEIIQIQSFLSGWFGIFFPPLLTWIVPCDTYGDRNQWRHVQSGMYVNLLWRENNFMVFHLDPSFCMLFFCLLGRRCFNCTCEWVISEQKSLASLHFWYIGVTSLSTSSIFFVFVLFTRVFICFTWIHKLLVELYCVGFGFGGKEVGVNELNLINPNEILAFFTS